jgi:hypothetical protein
LEGVSVVMKSTPPGLSGEKRLTRGYPAITATVVNLRQPVVSYANWFSYITSDFLSQNREIERSSGFASFGGNLGLRSDRDGLYVLLQGISAVWQTAATLAFLVYHPFPRRY